jgi:hypothetical protein
MGHYYVVASASSSAALGYLDACRVPGPILGRSTGPRCSAELKPKKIGDNIIDLEVPIDPNDPNTDPRNHPLY